MIHASQDFINTMIGADATLYARIELLDKDENVIQRFDSQVIDGSISVDKDQDIRRQFNLTIENDDNAFTWSVGGLIWIDKRIKFYVGLMTPNGIEYVPQGVFLLTDPDAESKEDGTREAHFSGADKWKLLDGQPLGKFETTTTIDVNVPIDQAIMLLASKAGIPNSQCAFETCTVQTPYSLSYQPGEPIGKAIRELADLAVYDCYFDVNGFLRFRPKPSDMTTQPSVWTYDKSDWTIYAGSKKVLDTSTLYNRVLVIGGSQQTGTVSAIATNDDPNDPLSTINIGVRLSVYNNGSPAPLITTNELAQDRADWELENGMKITERQQFVCLPNFMHEESDVITIVDDCISTNDKYELLRFNIPFKPGATMQGEAWRTRKVGA